MCLTIAAAPLVFVGDEVTAVKKEYKNYVFDLYGTLVDIHTDEENGQDGGAQPLPAAATAGLLLRRGAEEGHKPVQQRTEYLPDGFGGFRHMKNSFLPTAGSAVR